MNAASWWLAITEGNGRLGPNGLPKRQSPLPWVLGGDCGASLESHPLRWRQLSDTRSGVASGPAIGGGASNLDLDLGLPRRGEQAAREDEASGRRGLEPVTGGWTRDGRGEAGWGGCG